MIKMIKAEGYTKYCGNGTLTETNDFNECYAIKIDNAEGAENLLDDMRIEGYTRPNLEDMDENDFPLVIWFNDIKQEWYPMFGENYKAMETAVKLFKKVLKEG